MKSIHPTPARLNRLKNTTLTVHVRIDWLLTLRIWVAVKVIQFGAWLGAVGFQIKDERQ